MPQHSILSSLQIKILLEFMEAHKDLAVCWKPSDALQNLQTKRKQSKLWDELTTQLNNAGKTKKSAVGWRKFWAEKKHRARRKFTEINRAQKHRKEVRTSLNQTDSKILSLLNLPTKWEPTDDPIESEESISSPSDLFVENKNPLEVTRQYPTLEIKPLISNHTEYDDTNDDSNDDNEYVEVEPELDISQTVDGTPQWAVDIEERRAAATERIATSLEKLTAAVVGMHNSLTALSTDVATIKTILASRPP